ncbi:unnamed protein product, partial [marine sediment metagenome]
RFVMPEVLGNPPSPRTPLVWDGTAYRVIRGHTDGTVQVRGEDQLFSFDAVVAEATSGAIAAADGFWDSASPPAGSIWVITNLVATDTTSPTTRHIHRLRVGAANTTFSSEQRAFAIGDQSQWHGHIYLAPTNVVRVSFEGAAANDWCVVEITGYQMTLET